MGGARDYRAFLRAVGRKPIKGDVRTPRRPGDLEIVLDVKSGKHVLHRYPPAPRQAKTGRRR